MLVGHSIFVFTCCVDSCKYCILNFKKIDQLKMVTCLFKKRVKKEALKQRTQIMMTLVQISGSRRIVVIKEEEEVRLLSQVIICRLKSTDDSLLFIAVKAGPYHAQ